MTTERTARGRIVIGTLGLDQHEVGAFAVGQLLTRHGYEVVYLGRFNTPETLVTAAVDEDAQIVGVSVHSWELESYVEELVERAHDARVAVVVGGSVLTEHDRDDLLGRGVSAVFGAYAREPDVVAVLDRLVDAVRTGALDDDGAETLLPLDGRVAIVTGAARGLGLAYATALSEQGAVVVANDIDAAALAAAAGTAGPNLMSVPCDASTLEGAAHLVETTLAEFGRLDAVIANAGVLRSGPILQLDDADVDAVLGVHVRGTFFLVQSAGRYWRAEAKAGRVAAPAVVTTTSSAGLYGFRGEAIYSAAKAAIATFTRVAADELGRYGVTVNAIAPVARTRLTAWLEESDAGLDGDAYSPEHVASLVCWLVGPRARDVSGRIFEVGGGSVATVAGWRRDVEAALSAGAPAAHIDRVLHDLLDRSQPVTPIAAADSKPAGER